MVALPMASRRLDRPYDIDRRDRERNGLGPPRDRGDEPERQRKGGGDSEIAHGFPPCPVVRPSLARTAPDRYRRLA
jgi:hypothetical protein